MSYNISQMIFFIKDQTSQHVSVERPIQVMFRKGISAGKAALQHFFFFSFYFSFHYLTCKNLFPCLSPGSLSCLRPFKTLQWDDLPWLCWCDIYPTGSSLLSIFGTALDMGYLLFPWRSPFFPRVLLATICGDWFCLQLRRDGNLLTPDRHICASL